MKQAMKTIQMWALVIKLGAYLTLTVLSLTAVTRAQVVAENHYKPELVVQTGHADAIKAVAFSADGRTLASDSSDDTKTR